MPQVSEQTVPESSLPGNSVGQDRVEAIANPKAIDPFDPENLRLKVVGHTPGVRKLLTTIQVCKPSKDQFVRTQKDPRYWLDVWAVEQKEDRSVFIADPSLAKDLSSLNIGRMFTLVLTVSRQGNVFFWPLRIHAADDGRRPDHWLTSAREAAEKARVKWIRVVANMANQSFDLYEAEADLPEPEWPSESMRDLLEIAFRGNGVIKDIDHPVIRGLRGLA
jgi:hypothetical protein